jgi:Lrp/AsnC family transcriptional regulator for asnA, asnC and gidA
MTDTESDSDEISQETDTLLGEIMTEVLPKEEVQLAPDSQPSVTRDSPTNSTAEDILDILLADARMPISEIADQADVSEPTVRKYIDRLESKDIIVGYSVDVNPENLRNQTVSLVRIEIDRAAIEEATAALASMEPVRSLFLLKEETVAMAEVRGDGFMKLGEIVTDDILAIGGVEAAHSAILEERYK